MPVLSRRALAGLLAAAFLAVSPAVAADIEVQHAQGTTRVPQAPKKVVVFDLASLDTMAVLGVAPAGVPGGIMPPAMAHYATSPVPKVGTLFEPDFEAIAALEPDLIIISGRTAPKYAALSKIAPTIDLSVDGAHYFSDAKERVRTLGRIFGKQAQAEAAIAKLDASVAALRSRLAEAGTGLLILTTGGKLSTYGAGSRFGLIFNDLGMRQADAAIKVGTHGQPASYEYILEKNPDWLFVIDRDAAVGRESKSAATVLDNEIVGRTTAWRKKQVVYLDPASWYLIGNGLTALQGAVDQIAKALDRR